MHVASAQYDSGSKLIASGKPCKIKFSDRIDETR